MLAKLGRKKWLLLGAVSLVVLLYFGTYFYLRRQHVFIHRAGNYAYDSRLGIERHTNHYVEPGRGAEGNQIFAIAALASATVEGELNVDAPEFELILKEATEEVARAQRHWNHLFVFFKPAAFLETVAWKLIDPNPLAP